MALTEKEEYEIWVRLFTEDYGHDNWLLWLMLNELYYETEGKKSHG
jgi:hypothetical protein